MSDASRDAGVRALQQGDPKAALQHLAQAIQQNPQDAQAHAFMGAAYGQLNMPQQAVESLTHATQLAPLSAPIRFNLAVMLEKSGRRDEAVSAYRQVVVLDVNYERARQALTRLGETATTPGPAPGAPPAYPPQAPAPPAYPPSAASPAPAAPGLSDFAIGGSQSYSAPPAQPPSPYGAPPPQVSPYGAPPPQTSPYGAPPAPAPTYGSPPPMGGHPVPGAAPPLMAPPSLIVPPAAAGPAPPGGMQPLGDWAPPPSAAPPSGGPPGAMQPLGEWSPPPGGLAAGQTAPPPPPRTASPSGPGGATVAVVDHPEMMLSRSAQLGHCYLAGMGMGVWWGLLGAVFTFLRSMTTVMSSDLGRMMPLILTLCLMNVALGALLYGLIGLAGGKTEDAEAACGNFGLALGILGALVGGIVVSDQLVMLGGPTVLGSIWVSRKLGQSLGIKINEMQSSVFVVAGPGGVSAMAYRKH